MGWLMFFVGLVLPPLIGWALIAKRGADIPLTLLGLASLPVLVWSASLGAKIGPCKVGACMSSGQHDRLVFGLVAIGILLVALGLLAAHQLLAAGAGVVVAQLVGAFSMTRTDNTALVMLLIFAAATLGYLAYVFTGRRERVQVPDYPPAG